LTRPTGRRRPQWWFYGAAALISIALLILTTMVGMAGVSAFCRRTGRRLPAFFRHLVPFGQALHRSAYRELLQELKRQHPESFRTVWDVDVGVSLSRDLYLETPMYGETRYRYRPRIQAVDFTVWSGLDYHNFLVLDTPRIEALVDRCNLVQKARFETDENGFKTGAFPVPRGRPTVLFVGDSFTEGLHVAAADTFSDRFGRLAREAGIPVTPVNTGVNGYGALEECWTVETWATRMNAVLVVVNLFPNDAGEDFMQVIEDKAPARNYEEMFRWLDRLRRFCGEHAIALVISAIPAQPQLAMTGPSPFERRVGAWCARSGILFLQPLETFRASGSQAVYFTWDPHLHAGGHDVYARFLFESLRPTLALAFAVPEGGGRRDGVSSPP